MRSGPVIIGYDGSDPSERALREGATLLAPRRALVVVVWEAGWLSRRPRFPPAA